MAEEFAHPDLQELDELSQGKMITIFVIGDNDVRVGTDEGIGATQLLLAAKALDLEAEELMGNDEEEDA